MTDVFWISYLVLWVLFIVLTIAMVGALQSMGHILERMAKLAVQGSMSKLQIGHPVPNLQLQTYEGDLRWLTTYKGTRAAIHVLSTNCDVCRDFLDEIVQAKFDPDPYDHTIRRRILIFQGNPAEFGDLTAIFNQGIKWFIDSEKRIKIDWGIPATPMTVVVDENMTILRIFFGLVGEMTQSDNVTSVINNQST